MIPSWFLKHSNLLFDLSLSDLGLTLNLWDSGFSFVKLGSIFLIWLMPIQRKWGNFDKCKMAHDQRVYSCQNNTLSKRCHWMGWIGCLSWLVVCQSWEPSIRIGIVTLKTWPTGGCKQFNAIKSFILWLRKSHQKWHIFMILYWCAAISNVSSQWVRDCCWDAQSQGQLSLDYFMTGQNKVSPNFICMTCQKNIHKSINIEW